MAKLEELLSKHIVNKEGESIEWESITGPGTTLCLYYSAHWCPPCRRFTPMLIEFYNKLKKGDKGKGVEFIFISSDSDEKAFNDYYKDMPWLALQFDQRDLKAQISKKHGVRGIPTLVIVNGETGDTITTKGRDKVMSEPDGFPWPPKSFAELFYAGDFVKNDGTKVKSEELKKKVKAIYFSAHWCPPCKSFTPILSKMYKKVKDSGKEFEIVFASSDKDEASYKEYFESMPWLALPFNDKRKEKLSDFCNVEGIPTLAIFDDNDRKITLDGRSAVNGDPEGKHFPWLPKALNEFNEGTAGPINDKACLIYFTDGKSENVETAKGHLQELADKEFNPDQDNQDLLYFYTAEDDDMIDSLIAFTKLKKKAPFIAIVNISGQEVTEYEGELNKAGIEQFVMDFRAGKLNSRSL
ncbi:nucleoredoxin-like [Watersipora subatra]|uniref:nucleoredoxin-like n=1 Tax=Watersipora subatra TaxID=2589382 RepID=UPI00355BE26C